MRIRVDEGAAAAAAVPLLYPTAEVWPAVEVEACGWERHEEGQLEDRRSRERTLPTSELLWASGGAVGGAILEGIVIFMLVYSDLFDVVQVDLTGGSLSSRLAGLPVCCPTLDDDACMCIYCVLLLAVLHFPPMQSIHALIEMGVDGCSWRERRGEWAWKR